MTKSGYYLKDQNQKMTGFSMLHILSQRILKWKWQKFLNFCLELFFCNFNFGSESRFLPKKKSITFWKKCSRIFSHFGAKAINLQTFKLLELTKWYIFCNFKPVWLNTYVIQVKFVKLSYLFCQKDIGRRKPFFTFLKKLGKV